MLDSLERCLAFLDELPYSPDVMVVEEDDLAGGAAAANTVRVRMRMLGGGRSWFYSQVKQDQRGSRSWRPE